MSIILAPPRAPLTLLTAWPVSQRQGRSEGQEATFTIMLQHGVTDKECRCPGEGARCRKHSSFPQVTDGWETGRQEGPRTIAR